MEGQAADDLPATSVFGSPEEASGFFEQGALGYSARTEPGQYDGLELRTFGWQARPLRVTRAESSFFDDQDRFPPGSISLDCALLMKGLAHEWHGRPTLCAACAG